MKKLLILILLFYCGCSSTNEVPARAAIKTLVDNKYNGWELKGYSLDNFVIEIGEKKTFEIHLTKGKENCVETIILERFKPFNANSPTDEQWVAYPESKGKDKESKKEDSKEEAQPSPKLSPEANSNGNSNASVNENSNINSNVNSNALANKDLNEKTRCKEPF